MNVRKDAKAQLDAIYGGSEPFVVPTSRIGTPNPPTRPAMKRLGGNAMSVDGIYANQEPITSGEPVPATQAPPGKRARVVVPQAVGGSKGPLFASANPKNNVFQSPGDASGASPAPGSERVQPVATAVPSPDPQEPETAKNALSFFEEPAGSGPYSSPAAMAEAPELQEKEFVDGDDSWNENMKGAVQIGSTMDDEIDEDPVTPAAAQTPKAPQAQQAKGKKKRR